MSAVATAVADTNALYQLIPIGELEEDPNNPRREYDPVKLGELAASMKSAGQLENLIARKVGDKLRIVVGHRRFRAAKVAGLQLLKVEVRELSDMQALEIQIIENLLREDCNPLEEADAFRRLHIDFKMSVDDIVKKTGKLRGTVYAKLKAAELEAPARKAALEAGLSHSHVLELARLHPKLQLKATKEAIDLGLSVSSLQEHLARNFALDLDEAPFDVSDATLSKLGACTSCKYNLSNQPEGGKRQLCLNAPCFEEKRATAWNRKVEAGRKGEGPKTLPEKENRKVFAGGYGQLRHDAPYVDLGANCWDDKKQRTYQQLMGKEAEKAGLVFLGQDDRGGFHKLVEKKSVAKLLKDAGRIEARKAVPEAQAKKEAERDMVADATMGAIVARLEAKEPSRAVWLELVKQQLDYRLDEFDGACERRGWDMDKLDELVEKLNAEQLRGLFFEASFHFEIYREPEKYGALFGVDAKSLKAQAKTDLELVAKAEKEAEKELAVEAKKPCAVAECGGKRTEGSDLCEEHVKAAARKKRAAAAEAAEKAAPPPAKKPDAKPGRRLAIRDA